MLIPAENAKYQHLWRSGWDSNPRALADNLISRGVKRLKPLISPHKTAQIVLKKPVKTGFFRILLFVFISLCNIIFSVWAPFGHHYGTTVKIDKRTVRTVEKIKDKINPILGKGAGEKLSMSCFT